MKNIYAFETKEEYEKYQSIICRFNERLKEYQKTLVHEYTLVDLPKGILWTSEELATSVFSNIPIPAYTNNHLIVMSPDLEVWRKIFVRQLEERELPNLKSFYKNYSENQLLVILAHELTHHSDLFLDDFEDERKDSIWFEEGMCFYLPRKLLLSEKEFNEITSVETELVEIFKDKYGKRSIDHFGSCSYKGSLSSIMYDYWRSYLAVKHLIEERANHDVKQVFDEYHNWYQEGRKVTLTEYFGLCSYFE